MRYLAYLLLLLSIATTPAADSFVCPPEVPAPDDREPTLENWAIEIDVLANDGTSQLGPIAFTSDPSYGTVETTVSGSGQVNLVYTPDAGFVGTDVFSYLSEGVAADVFIDVEEASTDLIVYPRKTVVPREGRVLIGSSLPALFFDFLTPDELQVWWDGAFAHLDLPDEIDSIDYVRQATSIRDGETLLISIGDHQTHTASDPPEVPAYFLAYDMSVPTPVLVEQRAADNDRARAPRLLRLTDGSLVFLWEELPTASLDRRTRYGIDYRRANGTWAPTLMVTVDHQFTPAIESNYTMAQHPVTDEIWIFNIADGVGDIGVINLSSDGTDLSLNWEDNLYIDFPGQCIEPDGELPWLETAVHDGAIYLGYQNRHHGTQFAFSSGAYTAFRAQRLTVVRIDASGNREFFDLPIRIERTNNDFALEAIDGFLALGFNALADGNLLNLTARTAGRMLESIRLIGEASGPVFNPVVAGDDTFVATTSAEIHSIEIDIYDSADDEDLDGVVNGEDNCITRSNPRQEHVVFDSTIVAGNHTTFSWPSPRDVAWVRGDLALVADYVISVSGSGDGSSLAAPEEPAAGGGFFYMVKPGGACDAASWQTIPGAEPGRDAG